MEKREIMGIWLCSKATNLVERKKGHCAIQSNIRILQCPLKIFC